MDPLLLVIVAAVGVALGALWFSARRAITIAELVVENGSMRVVSGGVAPPILADLRDVARTPKLRDGVRIRILRSSGRAEVEITGGEISGAQAQRIRNVIGSVPLARLLNAARRR